MREKCDKDKCRQGFKREKRGFFINRGRKEVTEKDIYQNGRWQSPESIICFFIQIKERSLT